MRPIVIYSDRVLNALSWFMRIGGMALFPVVILREYYKTGIRYPSKVVDERWIEKGKVTINHETIHFKQQLELLVIPFYVLYLLNWLINLFRFGNAKTAYREIVFEKEAYSNEENMDYVATRKPYSWIKYKF